MQKHLIKSNTSFVIQTLIKIEREGNFNLIKYIYKIPIANTIFNSITLKFPRLGIEQGLLALLLPNSVLDGGIGKFNKKREKNPK